MAIVWAVSCLLDEQATDGQENYYFLIQRSEEIQYSKAREIVQACLKTNAFFAHEENVLLALLASESQAGRTAAVTTE